MKNNPIPPSQSQISQFHSLYYGIIDSLAKSLSSVLLAHFRGFCVRFPELMRFCSR